MRMVRDFMVRHRSLTPLFTEVGQEFLEYLQQEREPQPDDWPFMLELAHYEYVELAVAISTADEQLGEFDPNGDLLRGRPLVGPTAWNLSYQWPVHTIGPGEPAAASCRRSRPTWSSIATASTMCTSCRSTRSPSACCSC